MNDWIDPEGCPKALDWWQYKGRHSITKMPDIELATFPKELRSWWIGLQPSARRGTSLLHTPNARNTDWSSLQHGGLDGMFAVVMCLSWYMVSVPPPADQRPFDDLVDDVMWVFTCLNAFNENEDGPSASISTRRKSRSTVTAAKVIAPVSPKKRPASSTNKGSLKRTRA